MHVKLPTLLVAAGAVAALSGCGDSSAFGPSFPNRELSPVVFALNGTAHTLPAGLGIRGIEVRLVDPSFTFDLAFDIKPDSAVAVYTVRTLGSEVIATLPRVGLQTSTLPFDQVLSAPGSGFVYDSSLTLPLGQTMIVDKIDPSCGQFGGGFLGFNIRAKIRIDSVNLSTRAIYLKVLSNPNCGFKSLQPGEPKD